MNSTRPAAAVCAALILGACSIGKPIPPATTYIVEPAMPAAGSVPRRADTLRMGNVRVAAAFAGNALVYRLDDVQYVSDPYNAFIADPGAMLGSRMAESLNRAGPFKAVVQPGGMQAAGAAPYVLEATVTELFGDFRTPPAAVMTVQFTLLDTAGPRTTIAYERTISRRVAIAQTTPDALVRGYGQALTEILAALSADLTGGVAK